MKLKTKIAIAKTGSRSLKTTIPEAMVYYLNLKQGDIAEWEMETFRGKRAAILRRVENE